MRIFTLFFTVTALLVSFRVYAQNDAFRATPYPLPRFVSLSSDEAFVRAGPGTRYPVKWVYHKKGLPLEIVLEFEAWRKVHDHEGQSGWVHQSLLSGRRTGIIQGSDPVTLYKKPKEIARAVARIEPQVIGRIESCQSAWCSFEVGEYKGWVERKYIWGVYPNEIFD